MLGYENQELPGHVDAWKKLVHPDDLGATLDAVKSLFASGQDMYQSEFRMRHKNGAWVNILSRGFIVRDAR